MKKQENNCIGMALAGHAFRTDKLHKNNQGIRKRAEAYDNPLTDLVNLVIAEAKARRGSNAVPGLQPDATEREQGGV